MTISKKMFNAQVMESELHLFRCPICSSGMGMEDKSRLVCTDNHSFDLSKNGYVNLAPQAHVTKYDKSLFEARKTVMSSGFFNQVLEFITHQVHEHIEGREQAYHSGCGLRRRHAFVDNSFTIAWQNNWSWHRSCERRNHCGSERVSRFDLECRGPGKLSVSRKPIRRYFKYFIASELRGVYAFTETGWIIRQSSTGKWLFKGVTGYFL